MDEDKLKRVVNEWVQACKGLFMEYKSGEAKVI
jgi:hypothetical protein